jgi:hypothetical protein
MENINANGISNVPTNFVGAVIDSEYKEGQIAEVKKEESDRYIIGIIDSKTKGFERFADCYEMSHINPIKMRTLESRVYRI